jgi:hypothetical protein
MPSVNRLLTKWLSAAIAWGGKYSERLAVNGQRTSGKTRQIQAIFAMCESFEHATPRTTRLTGNDAASPLVSRPRSLG